MSTTSGHPGDAQRAQAPVDRLRIRPGVHHHARAVAGRETVASPCPTSHIANRQPGGGQPVRTLVSGGGRTTTSSSSAPQSPHSHGCPSRRRPSITTAAVASASNSAPTQLARPVHPRAGQRRPGPCHTRDPSAPANSPPGQRSGHRHRHGRRRQRREAQYRRRGDRELHQEIAGHRHQTHPCRQHRDDRGAHRLGGSCRRQRLREPRRHPAPPQGGAPPRRQRQQRPGGQDGQQEPVTPGQPGVVEHQQQNRRRQRRHAGICGGRSPRASSAISSAGRGTQHARDRGGTRRRIRA